MPCAPCAASRSRVAAIARSSPARAAERAWRDCWLRPKIPGYARGWNSRPHPRCCCSTPRARPTRRPIARSSGAAPRKSQASKNAGSELRAEHRADRARTQDRRAADPKGARCRMESVLVEQVVRVQRQLIAPEGRAEAQIDGHVLVGREVRARRHDVDAVADERGLARVLVDDAAPEETFRRSA